MVRPRCMARGESMLDMDVCYGSQKDPLSSERASRENGGADDCSTLSRSASDASLLTNVCGDNDDAASCDVAAPYSRRRRRRVSWYDGHPAALMPTPDDVQDCLQVRLLERLCASPLYPTLTVAAVCFCAWMSRRR